MQVSVFHRRSATHGVDVSVLFDGFTRWPGLGSERARRERRATRRRRVLAGTAQERLTRRAAACGAAPLPRPPPARLRLGSAQDGPPSAAVARHGCLARLVRRPQSAQSGPARLRAPPGSELGSAAPGCAPTPDTARTSVLRQWLLRRPRGRPAGPFYFVVVTGQQVVLDAEPRTAPASRPAARDDARRPALSAPASRAGNAALGRQPRSAGAPALPTLQALRRRGAGGRPVAAAGKGRGKGSQRVALPAHFGVVTAAPIRRRRWHR